MTSLCAKGEKGLYLTKASVVTMLKSSDAQRHYY